MGDDAANDTGGAFRGVLGRTLWIHQAEKET
jgi:hypothetical protein